VTICIIHGIVLYLFLYRTVRIMIVTEKNNINYRCFNIENYVIGFLITFVVYISWSTLQTLI